MSESKSQHEWPQADSFEQLRHDLMNPLATIRGRAQLLKRAVDRSAGIDEVERTRLLRGLAAIDQAVNAAVQVLDQAESRLDSPEMDTNR